MSIRSALAYTFSTRYLSMGLQFLATVILARLLSPEEIGVYSVGASVIMIAHTLRDFGTSTYVIQEQELTRARIGTAFTLTILVAWGLALALWLGSEPLAEFYREPRVGKVLAVLALNFVLIPFGSISMALLRRSMNFRAIMFISLVSTLVHSGASVAFAVTGFGYISLAWAAVCGTLITVLGAMVANPEGFFVRPTLIERRHVLAFSMRSSVSSIASEAGHSAPDMVLGRTVSMEGTGLFSRAMGYVQLFERLLQDVLRSVMLPYLADVERAGGNVREKLVQVLDNVVSVSLFIIALTAILAEPLILLLYGSQWMSVIPLAQILCVAMAIRCVAPTLSAALVASGRMTTVMRISVISSGMKFASLVLFSPFGLIYGAIGFAIAELLNLLVLLYLCNRSGMFLWSSYLSIQWKSLRVGVIGVLPAVAAVFVVPVSDNPLALMTHVAVAGLLSCGLWLVALWVFDAPPKQEIARLAGAVKSKFFK